jgi:ATP-dependent DNA ligase
LLGQQVTERGYEGLVAKDPASPYRGGRTLTWLKVKQRDYRVEERGWDPRNKS